MATRKITITFSVAAAAVVLSFVGGVYSVGHIGEWLKTGLDTITTGANAQGRDSATVRTAALAPGGVPSVELNDKQLASLEVGAVGEYVFPVEKAAVGSIARSLRERPHRGVLLPRTAGSTGPQ